jgi:hypothetical protein
MTNHYHIVLTDHHGNMPLFFQWLDSRVAKALNAHLGRWEFFWDPGSYDPQELHGTHTVINEIVYTQTNAVKAGLVKRARQWPGLTSAKMKFGQTIKVSRPEVYFDEKGEMPEEIEFTLTKPPHLAHLSDEEAQAWIDESVKVREEQIHREMREQGRAFAGKHSLRKLNPHDSPITQAPRRKVNPRVACSNPRLRIAILERLEAFVLEYRECLRRWRSGDRKVVFPEGTYKMRVLHAVPCRAPP